MSRLRRPALALALAVGASATTACGGEGLDCTKSPDGPAVQSRGPLSWLMWPPDALVRVHVVAPAPELEPLDNVYCAQRFTALVDEVAYAEGAGTRIAAGDSIDAFEVILPGGVPASSCRARGSWLGFLSAKEPGYEGPWAAGWLVGGILALEPGEPRWALPGCDAGAEDSDTRTRQLRDIVRQAARDRPTRAEDYQRVVVAIVREVASVAPGVDSEVDSEAAVQAAVAKAIAAGAEGP